MLIVNNLSYEFPQKDLYKNISFEIKEKSHCAFIGTNGTGKTTLLKILMNPDDYLYDGKITKSEQFTIGYVSQFIENEESDKQTVFDYIASTFREKEAEIAKICTEMETSEDLDSIFELYQTKLDEFDSIDGNAYESNIHKKLDDANLSFLENLTIGQLSGGEFKLVQVVKAMLNKPHMLIMDEPDVFLDFEHLNSLRKLINHHSGTLFVITHNRYLLHNCFDKILHLENMQLNEFDGNYTEYQLSLLSAKIEVQELAIKDQEEIDRNTAVHDRMQRLATAIDCAALGRAVHARETIVKRLEARKRELPFIYTNTPPIQFPTPEADLSDVILSVDSYTLSFDQLLLEKVTFDLQAKEKVAIIGANGTGKTTFLREIYQNENPAIKYSDEIKIGFVSQKQSETLDESSTVKEELYQMGFETNTDMLAFLEKFYFNKDYLDAKIQNLSGGEKNLFQLMKLSKQQNDLLLLDEPTSHLDLYAQIAFEKAIAEYQGAVLMVSHDFYTIANCVDYVYLIEEKQIRKMSVRKFRKMIYAKYFEKDYLEFDQQKKDLENKIEAALAKHNYELANVIFKELEKLVLHPSLI